MWFATGCTARRARLPLEEVLAAIEGGYRGMLMSSGLAAVTAPLQACSAPATMCLMVDSAYGPARNFCEGILKKCGVETTYYDPLIGEGIAQLMRPNTKVVYCRIAGLADLRDAGHPGDRRGRRTRTAPRC